MLPFFIQVLNLATMSKKNNLATKGPFGSRIRRGGEGREGEGF